MIWGGRLKVYSLILGSSFYVINKQIIHERILNPKFQPIPIVRQRVVHNNVHNAPLTAMVKILSDPIINQLPVFCPNNRSLQICFRISCFFYQFATKSIQYNKNLKFLADPPKIWEQHSKYLCILIQPFSYERSFVGKLLK